MDEGEFGRHGPQDYIFIMMHSRGASIRSNRPRVVSDRNKQHWRGEGIVADLSSPTGADGIRVGADRERLIAHRSSSTFTRQVVDGCATSPQQVYLEALRRRAVFTAQ